MLPFIELDSRLHIGDEEFLYFLENGWFQYKPELRTLIQLRWVRASENTWKDLKFMRWQ